MRSFFLGAADPRMAFAIWMRNVTAYGHTWKLGLLPNFFEPVLFLIGMGIGLGAYLERGMGGQAYIAFIAPGLMAASAMNGSSFETTYNMFVKMTFGKLYDAYLCTPAEIEDVQLGELLWAITRALIYGVGFLVVVGTMTLFGLPLLTSPWALLLPLALALIGILFGLIGQLFTSLIKVIDLYSYYFTLFLTPLFLFSGIFFPVSRFPLGEQIAWFTPLYHCVRLVRGLAQGPLMAEHLVSLAWILAVSAVLYRVVPILLRRRFKQ